MRFPKRTRGLVLGAVTLVAGPVIAASLTSEQPAAPLAARTSAVAITAVPAVRVVPIPHLLRARSPIPRPAPAPAPPVVKPRPRTVAIPAGPVDRSGVAGIIYAAAARWGVSGDWMVKIARCESGLNPHAYNPRGPYYGLFQFLMSTFTHNGGTNIWDPADQANITAKMLAHGQAHQWACA